MKQEHLPALLAAEAADAAAAEDAAFPGANRPTLQTEDACGPVSDRPEPTGANLQKRTLNCQVGNSRLSTCLLTWAAAAGSCCSSGNGGVGCRRSRGGARA